MDKNAKQLAMDTWVTGRSNLIRAIRASEAIEAKKAVAMANSLIRYGDYVAMIDKWFYARRSFDTCIVLEMIVVEAKPKISHEGDKMEPNAVGSLVSDIARGYGYYAPVRLFDVSETDPAREGKIVKALEYSTGDMQPDRGMLIDLSAYPKKIHAPRAGRHCARSEKLLTFQVRLITVICPECSTR